MNNLEEVKRYSRLINNSKNLVRKCTELLCILKEDIYDETIFHFDEDLEQKEILNQVYESINKSYDVIDDFLWNIWSCASKTYSMLRRRY
jgi:hypothetical protein